jgi:hypothetical protein
MEALKRAVSRRRLGREPAYASNPDAQGFLGAHSLGFAQGRSPDPANSERQLRVFPSPRSPAASLSRGRVLSFVSQSFFLVKCSWRKRLANETLVLRVNRILLVPSNLGGLIEESRRQQCCDYCNRAISDACCWLRRMTSLWIRSAWSGSKVSLPIIMAWKSASFQFARMMPASVCCAVRMWPIS